MVLEKKKKQQERELRSKGKYLWEIQNSGLEKTMLDIFKEMNTK